MSWNVVDIEMLFNGSFLFFLTWENARCSRAGTTGYLGNAFRAWYPDPCARGGSDTNAFVASVDFRSFAYAIVRERCGYK